MEALAICMPSKMVMSIHLAMTASMTMASQIMIGMGSSSRFINTYHGDTTFSGNSFLPCIRSKYSHSSDVNPVENVNVPLPNVCNPALLPK